MVSAGTSTTIAARIALKTLRNREEIEFFDAPGTHLPCGISRSRDLTNN
jgi:hypothetical protein